jgi:hypothetical protein
MFKNAVSSRSSSCMWCQHGSKALTHLDLQNVDWVLSSRYGLITGVLHAYATRHDVQAVCSHDSHPMRVMQTKSVKLYHKSHIRRRQCQTWYPEHYRRSLNSVTDTNNSSANQPPKALFHISCNQVWNTRPVTASLNYGTFNVRRISERQTYK